MSILPKTKFGDCANPECGAYSSRIKKAWSKIENKYKGKKIGRWTIGAYIEHRGKGIYYFECICDCGKIKVRDIKSIKDGRSTSCGCYAVEMAKKALTTHHAGHTKEYRIWTGMKTRCYNKNRNQYKNYGGRGIIVCERWLNSFENFYSDMGDMPTLNHTLDRIDNNGNYEPSNCRWATRKEQCGNKSNNIHIEWNNKTQVLLDWSKELKIPMKTLYNRYHEGRTGLDLFFNGKHKSVKKV